MFQPCLQAVESTVRRMAKVWAPGPIALESFDLSPLPYFLAKTARGLFAGADPNTTTSAKEKR